MNPDSKQDQIQSNSFFVFSGTNFHKKISRKRKIGKINKIFPNEKKYLFEEILSQLKINKNLKNKKNINEQRNKETKKHGVHNRGDTVPGNLFEGLFM